VQTRRDARALAKYFAWILLYVANEGKLLAIVKSDSAAIALQHMREHPLGRDAQIIGESSASMREWS
jgi:hydrogenase expression/formation protein HypE